MLQNNNSELITLDELCEYLNIGKTTAYNLLKSGELQGAFRIGRIWKIPRYALADFVLSKRNGNM